MQIPFAPGFHPTLTGSPERHETNGIEGFYPPRFLVSQVYRHGPARWWVRGPLRLLFAAQEIVLVWESERIPVGDDVMSAEWKEVSDVLMQEAQAIAKCTAALEMIYEEKRKR